MFTRNFQFCRPECSERQPGCHSHCEYHAERKKIFEELKAKNNIHKEVLHYTAEQKTKNHDYNIKCKRRFAGSNWRRYGK